MNAALKPMGTVTSLDDARERRQRPLVCIEVKVDYSAFMCALHREIEAMALVRSQGPSDPDWTPRLHARTRVAFAEQVAADTRGTWGPYLTVLTGPLPPMGWRPPNVATFEQQLACARAVAGHLFLQATLSALDEDAWTNRSQERMQEWRVSMFRIYRDAIDQRLTKYRVERWSIVRTTTLCGTADDGTDEPSSDDRPCGYAIEVYPMHASHLGFASGLEAVRARLGLGLSVADGAQHDAQRAAGGWVAGEALTRTSLRVLDPNHGD